MKKAIAILAIAVLGGNTINAQDDAGVRFGIKLAPNMAWTRSDTKGLESDGNLLGYTFGLMAEFPLGASGNYRFASGLLLNNIGGKYVNKYSYAINNVTSEITSTATAKLRYVELPLTIKMMTNEIGYMRYFGQIGLSAAVNLRSKVDSEVANTTNGVVTRLSEDDIDVKDDTSPFKAGLVIGGGLEYNFSGNTSILAGITYNNSFTKLYEKEAFADQDNVKIFADYIELTLGVFF